MESITMFGVSRLLLDLPVITLSEGCQSVSCNLEDGNELTSLHKTAWLRRL